MRKEFYTCMIVHCNFLFVSFLFFFFFLQFRHFGCIQAHRHTGGASSVTHFSDHASPLLLVLLIPENAGKKMSLINKRKYLVLIMFSSFWIKEHLLPYVCDFAGCTLFVLILHHCEAADGVQHPIAADQVDWAPLLRQLWEGWPPAKQDETRDQKSCLEVLLYFWPKQILLIIFTKVEMQSSL